MPLKNGITFRNYYNLFHGTPDGKSRGAQAYQGREPAQEGPHSSPMAGTRRDLSGAMGLGGQIGKNHHRQGHFGQQLRQERIVVISDQPPPFHKHTLQDH
jgi:hypothetical protein